MSQSNVVRYAIIFTSNGLPCFLHANLRTTEQSAGYTLPNITSAGYTLRCDVLTCDKIVRILTTRVISTWQGSNEDFYT